MKFKELSIEELKKEINNFLSTKTSDEIIDVLEEYSYSDKLQLLYNKISYLNNDRIYMDIQENIYIESASFELDYTKDIKYNNPKVNKKLYDNYNEWECDAA